MKSASSLACVLFVWHWFVEPDLNCSRILRILTFQNTESGSISVNRVNWSQLESISIHQYKSGSIMVNLGMVDLRESDPIRANGNKLGPIWASQGPYVSWFYIYNATSKLDERCLLGFTRNFEYQHISGSSYIDMAILYTWIASPLCNPTIIYNDTKVSLVSTSNFRYPKVFCMVYM